VSRSGVHENPQQEKEVTAMKEKKATKRNEYEKPLVRPEKEAKELSLNCPTTNVKYCGTPYSPKKG
jgi:hypothetical protein